MGTPQTRWREMHQSGRVWIMFDRRSSPHAGSHFTFLISPSVRVRAAVSSLPATAARRMRGVSIEMNHCSVARKITGLWQRQQCGYECSVFSLCSSAPRLFTRSRMGWLASHTRLPFVLGQAIAQDAFFIDVAGGVEAVLDAGHEVFGAVRGRGVDDAGAGVHGDVVGEHAENFAVEKWMLEVEAF